MDKDLERHAGGIESLQFPQGKFPCKYRTGNPKSPCHLDSLRGGKGHLGGGMNRKLRDNRSRKSDKPDILNDQGINATAIEQAKILRDVIEFTSEDEGVEGDIGLHPMAVAESRYLGKFFLGEVVRTDAGIESGQTKENSIGTVGHSSLKTIPPPGGGK
jgi:hypothetical protein